MSLPLSLRVLLVVAALSATALGVLVALSRSQITQRPSPPQIQELVLPDLEGHDRAMTEWSSKTLLINFWATWCAPCREEIPLLEKAQASHADGGLQVIGVAIDDPVEATAYLRQMRITYPVLLGDFETLSWTAREGNNAQVLPFTLIVSPGGKVLAHKVGSYTKSELQTVLTGLFPANSAAR